MDFGLIGLSLALIGLTFGFIQSLRIERKLKKYEPLVKRATSFIGSLGKEAQMNNQATEEVEDALKEGVFTMLEQKHPEIALVMMWLEENKPEIFSKIEENPAIVMSLYKKYAPIIQGFMGGKNRETRQMYDV